jgi:hypothetical protein
MLPINGFAEESEASKTTITVAATATNGDKFIVNNQALTVSSDEAENFGYSDSLTDGVSALDVLVKMHEEKYGEAFTKETASNYLAFSESGWITVAFEDNSGSLSYYVNNGYANGLSDEVSDGGTFELFFYKDTTYWSDVYTHLSDITAIAGEETTINASYYGAAMAGVKLANVDGLNITPIDGAVADSNGDIKVTFDKPGTYYVTLAGTFNHQVTINWLTYETTLFDSPIVPSVTKVTVVELPNDTYTATTQTIQNRNLAYGSEWSAMGLARAGISVPNSYYKSVMDSVNSGSITKVTDAARTIIALTSMGKKADSSLLEMLSSSDINSYGITASIYALIALDTANYEIPTNSDTEKQNTRDIMIKSIIDNQNSNGGFAYASSLAPSVDVTAMAVQALAKYTDKDGVSESIEKALKYIEENVYVDDTNSPDKCSTLAQVIVAYTELGKNPSAYVDKMLEYYDGNGQFKYNNAANDLSTTQAYYALVSYYRWANGENSLYDMTDAFYEIKSYDGEKCVIYSPFNSDATVIGVKYSNGIPNNISAEAKTLKKGENTIDMQSFDKIMLWNSLSDMQPLCEVKAQ